MPFLAPAIAAVAISAGATATAAAVIGAVGSTVIGVGVSLGAQMLVARLRSTTSAPQAASNSGPAGVQTSVQFGGAVPRSAIYGKMATAGALIYWNVYGTNNEFLQFVYAIGDGRHDGIAGIYIDGKAVTFGTVTPGADTPVSEFSKDGVDYLWFRYFTGSESQAADSALIANANPAGRWTTNHKLSGISYVSVTMRYEETLFPNGVPQFLFVVRGLRLYDPRKDSTNGGSGSHRWNDPTTYEWSENPAICLYNFQRGLFLGGELVLGQGISPVDLITDMYVAAANVCDESVALAAGGTELRYRVGEQVTADRQYRDVIQDFLAAMAGQLLETAGAFGPIAGAAQTPVMTITDADLIDGQPRTYSSHRSRNELINTITGSFSDPSQNWQPVAYPMRTSSADETTDGDRLGVQRDYPQINSATQVQRVAEIERRLARAQATATEVFPFKFSVLESGDWITRTSTLFNYNKTFQVVSAQVDKDQSVRVTLREISASVYAWNGTVDEIDPQVPGDLPGYGSPITTVSGFSLSATTLNGNGGVKQPALIASWSPVTDRTVTDVIVQYRVAAQPSNVSTAPLFRPADGSGVITDGIQGAATGYEARASIITQPARVTTWTSWVAVTGPTEHVVKSAVVAASASSVAAADIVGQLVSAQIANAAITAVKLAAAAVTATAFASGIEPVSIVSSVPNPSGYTGPNTVYNTTDGKLYRYASGAFTADVAAVNITGQLIAGQISAGAIGTTQLAAGAVTTPILAAGAVTANILAVGTNANMLANSDGLARTVGTQVWFNSSGAPTLDFVSLLDDATLAASFNPIGMGGWYIRAHNGTTSVGGSASVQFNVPNVSGTSLIPVVGGKYYDSSCYLYPLSTGSTGNVVVFYYDETMTLLSAVGGTTTAPGNPDARFLKNWSRSTLISQAPTGAAWARFAVTHNYAGGLTDEYMFFAAPYFGVANPNQTESAPWSPSGVTVINGGQIVANSITADKILANSITAAQIDSASIRTSVLTAGAINASSIVADNIVVAGHILADNAVKVSSSGTGALGLSFNGVQQTIHSLAFSSSGYKTTILATVRVDADLGIQTSVFSTWDLRFDIYIDGSALESFFVTAMGDAPTTSHTRLKGSPVGIAVTIPSAGSHTCYIKCTPVNAGSASVTIASGSITVIEGIKAT